MVLFTTTVALSSKSVRPYLKGQSVNCIIYFFNLFTLKPPLFVICKIVLFSVEKAYEVRST